MTDTLVNQIIKYSEDNPDKIAVIFKKEQLSFSELNEKMINAASKLVDLGIKKGDRVLFSAISKPESVVLYLAIHYVGGVAVFIDKNATSDTAAYIYRETGAKIFFTDKPMVGHDECNTYSLKKLITEKGLRHVTYVFPKMNELAELIYTSGTTGSPKGVMLTYKAVYNIFMNTIEGIKIDSDVRLLLPLPLNHSFALRVLRAVLYQGGCVVLQNGFTFAKEVENNIIGHQCNAMVCVPASYELMKSQMQDVFVSVLSRLKYLEFSAGALSVAQRREITGLLPKVQIYNTWGSSESGGAIFCDVTACADEDRKEINHKHISMLGKPLQDKVEVKILDQNCNEIHSDAAHPGRLCLKGDMQMSGYWNNDEETNKSIVDGWLITGDMAYIEEGSIYMLGRADDIINVGGEKVSPIELENIAGQYEYIRECACIGVEDPEGITGQVPVMFVVTKNGYNENDFKKYLANSLERFKIPKYIIRISEMPRNRMQKIDRKKLSATWKNRDVSVELNDIIQNIMTRRSVRNFTEDEIPKEVLEIILKAGYFAPSGHNMQTWKFTVLRRKEDIQRLKSVASLASKDYNVHFYGWNNPSTLVLISNDIRNQDGCQDCACASENIMLAAWSYGIGSVWLNPLMTLRDKEPVKSVLDEFGVPQNHVVWSAIALGYPLAEGTMLKKKSSVVEWIE